MKAVARFVLSQGAMGLAAFVFLFLLIPGCLRRAWVDGGVSINDGRPIDKWRWPWLQWVCGNPEDGVSGQTALVWVDGKLEHYMPGADDRWRAYCWNIRNSVDELKYRLAWAEGPLWEWSFSLFGRSFRGKAGWQMENGYNVPVFSPL